MHVSMMERLSREGKRTRFALRLVKCLERLGLIEVSGNYAMPNLEKLAELGLYEVAVGKVTAKHN